MTGMNAQEVDRIVGHTDGFRLGYVEGWVWRPNRPHDKVVVELLVDGAVVAEAAACLYRADLNAVGIGHGQHAFSIPLTIEPDAPQRLHVTVRAKNAETLPGGELVLETTEKERVARAERRSLEHLERVFGPFTSGPALQPSRPAKRAVPMNFVLHAARADIALANTLGTPEYSYVFVMRGYRKMLRRLGTIHAVREAGEADAIYDACLARGESCVLLSFAPPQSTPLGLRCPTIPVIAWEFSTIPTGGWPGDPREDWRLVLRQLGRAITLSHFAARAIQATMGAMFPVACVPTPVWDRLAGLRARLAASPPALHGRALMLQLDGPVWDSRGETWSPAMLVPKLPATRPRVPAAVLPIRGAQLALALASRAARAEQAARVLAAEAPPAQLPAFATTVRTTALLARQWYREVVRDALPRPAAAMASKIGRLAVSMRGQPRTPQRVVQDTTGSTEPSPSPQALPVTARYLPVDNLPRAEPATPPRYLAAPGDPPLPEPSLAVFQPDHQPAQSAQQNSGPGVEIGGTIFTAILSPKDGRKNWQDIMTAFVIAFADKPDATLLIKMIGSDPTYWWSDINGLAKNLPPFACRVVAASGFLPDNDYQSLIAATHVVVNASLAEGQCLPLVEFMSAGRPAIAPLHTAMLDYIAPANAFIVRSDVEFCSWPHDPRNHLLTTRHRIEWPSLRDAFCAAWRVVHDDPARYEAMAQAAADSVAAYCSDAVVAPVLASFLGLGDEALARCGWNALPRPEAEPAQQSLDAASLLKCAPFEPAALQP